MTDVTRVLKPCPFCGEYLRKMSDGMGYYHPKKNCTLSDFHMHADGYSEDRWNARASEAQRPERIAQLEADRDALVEALEIASSLVDTPIARRRLNLDGGDERLVVIRTAMARIKGDKPS